MKVNFGVGGMIKIGLILISIFLFAGIAFSADSSVSGWKQVIEAANKEGRVVISGPPGEEWRKSIVDMFQQEYPKITVEFSAMAGRNFGDRIRKERELGKKLWDLRFGGPNTVIDAKRLGFLSPIRPLLRQEIADDSKWMGGIDGTFCDKEKMYVFGYSFYAEPSAHVNRDYIKDPDFKSSSQLLDPKFRGKIVIQTPTRGSTHQALGHMAFLYGENFIREFLSKQDVIITDDNRQQVEWVVRGKYPISTNFAPTLLIPYLKQGLGKNIVNLEDKISRATTGSGSVSLLEGGPHPNASRVYINWLLSQTIQTKLSKNTELNSRRTDVPVVDRDSAVDPTKMSKYRNAATEENSDHDGKLLPLIRAALKR